MNSDTQNDKDTIIDLDADQVVEQVGPAVEEMRATLAKPVARGRSSWLLAGVTLVAAAAAGGWLYRDVLSNYYPPDQTRVLADKITILESSNAALREQLLTVDKLAAQLKTDIDTLEAKDANLSGLAEAAQTSQVATTEKLTALEQALGETRQAVADIAARPVTAADGTSGPVDTSAVLALQKRIDSLEKDVASLKVKPAEPVDNTAALTQNLSDLKAKIATGTGYRDEFERIQRMVPAASGLDVLQQHAALGLPDAKGLGAELKGMIPDLPKPIIPGPVPESEGWWASILDSLSGLITIRVEGDVDWPTAASAAAALADSGDLPQAIEQLNAIEVAKPVGIQQWIDRATGRIAIEKAVQSVEEAVLRVIAAKG